MLFTIRAKILPSSKSLPVEHVCIPWNLWVGSVSPYHVITGLVTPPHTYILPECSLHVGSQVSGITVVLSFLLGHKAYSRSQ